MLGDVTTHMSSEVGAAARASDQVHGPGINVSTRLAIQITDIYRRTAPAVEEVASPSLSRRGAVVGQNSKDRQGTAPWNVCGDRGERRVQFSCERSACAKYGSARGRRGGRETVV